VFNAAESTRWRAAVKYAPQRALNQALSSYAPGRDVWVDGERYYSFALWTPFRSRDLLQAQAASKVYFECERCGYARVDARGGEHFVGQTLDCPACGSQGALRGQRWLRPPGFAHPVDMSAELPQDEGPAQTRANAREAERLFPRSGPLGASTRYGGGRRV
jgi:hypothetical protein